jgi:uncharacterized repeat protein (TIGR02543 family)
MNIRAFGRLLFSGFGLPKLAFRESNFLPEPKPKTLFEALRSTRKFGPLRVSLGAILVAAFLGLGLATASANSGAQVSAPTSVNATAGPGTITVTWGVPADLDNQTVWAYNVAISTDGTNWTNSVSVQVSSTTRSHTFSNLSSATPYYSRVQAVTALGAGTGAWGYDWELAYKTTNISRGIGNNVVYTDTPTPANLTRTDFTRVRYILRGSGNWVDLDFRTALTSTRTGNNGYTNLSRLQVPTTNSPNIFIIRGEAEDLTVSTNLASSTVQKGSGLRGHVEIWPWNYWANGGLLGSNDGLYDWSDSPTLDGDHGSFQFHTNNSTNTSLNKTIVAWNLLSRGGEFGFGTAPAGQHPDWTSVGNGWSISGFSFESYANHPVTPQPATAPGAPTIGTATSTGTTTATVSFTLPANNGGATITSYTVTSSPPGGTGTLSQAGSGTINVTGLTHNTAYTFTVRATNSAGTSSASSASNSITTAAITHQITFDANGGTGTMAQQTVIQGVSTQLSANVFTRAGFVFRGWNSAANGTGSENFSNQANITRSAAITLYAMWTSLEDRAWSKTATLGNYAGANISGGLIPTANNSQWTVEAWIRPTSFPTDQWSSLISQMPDTNSSTDRDAIWLYNGVIWLMTPGGSVDTGVTLSTNRWIHIAWTMPNAGNSQLYVDGSLVWQNSNNRGTTNPSRTFFSIGGARETRFTSFEGEIDQVKIWGAALSATQVAASMHEHSTWTGSPAGNCVQGTGLRALYDFNEFNTGVVLDRSGCDSHLPFNSAISGSYASGNFTSSSIVERSTPFSSLQNVVKFNRSFLTATGGWTPPSGFARAKLLVVGGGGGGGGRHGGGGGAGGFIETEVTLTQQVQRITVGPGGLGSPYLATNQSINSTPARTQRGGDSIAFGLTAQGGGAGSGKANPSNSADFSGGSGGGTDTNSLFTTPGSGQAGQGNSGGQGTGGSNENYTGGGGGGAGSAGSNGVGDQGGKGGDGRASSITGTRTLYSGGGGGASNSGSGGAGGSTVGGSGGVRGNPGTAGTNGLSATGSGGGGAGFSDSVWAYSGGSGGSGVVILSYGASMDVTQTPGGARAGSTFQRPITVQLKNSDGTNYTGVNQQVTLTASSSTVLRQTVNGVTSNVTSVTVSSNGGVATFADIGFQSGVTGAQTLTVTADAFVGTSLSVTPTFVAATVNINSTGPTTGSFIEGVFQSSTGTTATILNSDLVSAMTQRSILVESTGEINVVNGFTSSTSASDITLKARGSITVSTSQTIRTNGGDVVFWSDSDVSGGGVIRILNNSEICTTSGTCNSATSGGGDIVLAGGAASTADASRPGGFAAGFGTTYNTTGSTTTTGVQIGTMGVAGGSRLYSAGGSLTILGSSTVDNTNSRMMGVDVVAGSILNSGSGMILVEGTTRSANVNDARPVTLDTISTGSGITITSTNSSSSAVVIRSYASGSGGTTHSGLGASSVRVNSAGGFVIQADRIGTSLAVDFNVAGPIRIEPFSTTMLNGVNDTTTFTFTSAHSFTQNPSSITIGSSTNTSPIVINENLQTISGNIELLTSGAISKSTTTLTSPGEVIINSRSGAVNTGSGAISATSVRIEAGTTVALEGNITAGTSGTLVRSGGRITGSAGTSAANPLLLSSRGGPITLWTTGSTGGVALADFTQLNTTQFGASGADITIGGGSASSSDATRPTGNAVSSSGTAVALGSSEIANVVQILSGTGNIVIRGEGTSSNGQSGVSIEAGVRIIGSTVEIFGKNVSSTGDDADFAAVFHYGNSSSAKTLIEATVSANTHRTALSITGQSTNSKYAMMLSNKTGSSVADQITLRTTGSSADIRLSGTTTRSGGAGIQGAGLVLSTFDGDVFIDTGLVDASLGRLGTGRESSYSANGSGPGGNITITAGSLDTANHTTGSFDVATTGTLTFAPPAGQSFTEAQTFPLSGSTTSVGNLVVGSAWNIEQVTAAASASSSGDITYFAGTFVNSASLTSTNGNVLLQADNMTLSTTANINIAASNGSVTLAPRTNNRVIDLGTNVVGRLSLTDAELDRISATTLRIGALSGTNTGNIEVTAAISPALTPTLALRTGGSGSVTSSGNRSITETNLGVQAGGTISLAASNVISGNLALNSPASTLTFNQSSGSFTPATVDGISAEYGVPSTLTLSRVPTTQTETRTLGETFSNVPEVTLRDEFSNLLTAANSQSSRYSITVTRASGTGTVSGTLVRSTTAGVASFDNLRIITNPGSHTLTFTATAVSAPAQIIGSLSATTGTYNIRTAQTITFGSLSNRTLGSSNTFTVTATSDRGLTVAFTSTVETRSVCTVSGTTVSMITAGTCRIVASQAGDSSNAPADSVQREFVVSSVLVLTTPSSGLTGTFNSAYTLTLARTGGASPYTFDVSAGTLPAGLTVESSTGVIRGIPSVASTQTVTLRVTDANGAIATTNAFTLTINRETLATPTAPTVAASTTSLKRLDVSWNAVSNASSYVVKLYDSTGSGSALATVSVTSGTSRTLSTSDYASFADLTMYTVSVQAIGISNYQDSLESSKTSARTRGLPQLITVDTAGVDDATGAWIDGTWYTATLGTSRVTPTSLQTQMNASNATLQTSGSITVSNAIASPNASHSLNLTSTGSNVTVNAAISGLSGLTVTCSSGTFTNSSAGTISAAAAINVQCQTITPSGNLTSSGGKLTLKASGVLTVKTNVTLQTAGSDLVLWAGASGNGNIGVEGSTCLNTIGSCDDSANSSLGGNIYLGGGAAGTDFPTGPAASNSSNGVWINPTLSSAGTVRILSGQGDISIDGQSSFNQGLYLYHGAVIKSSTGQVSLRGTTSSNVSALRIELGATGTSISSGKTSGTAISLTGVRTAGDGLIGIGSTSFGTTLSATGGGNVSISVINQNTAANTKIEFGTLAISTSAGGAISLSAPGDISRNSGNFSANGSLTFSGRNIAMWGLNSGSSVTISPTGTYSGGGNVTATSGNLTISGGTSVEPTGVLQASGDVRLLGSGNITTTSGSNANITSTAGSVSITSTAATISLDRTVSAATAISLTANRLNLGATIGTTSSSGVVTIAPQTNSTVIDLGTEVSDRLSLTSTELNRVSAGTLRIGALNGSNSGTINVTAAIAPTGVQTLALRTSGTVESSGSGSITEVNLAISASVINLGNNNSITGNLALSSSGATLTYNQIAGSFTPATVDQVTPEYGVATQILMSQVPASTPVDEMMNVAFNPPPIATLKDKFGNELTTANSKSNSYTVTATKASGPGTLVGTESTTTSTRGVARFTNLGVSSTGVHRITFTATVTATSTQITGTPSATTGDYNIKTDQSVSFTSTAPGSARASGATYTPQATATSGLTVSITVDGSATSVCSISGGVVSFLAQGTCVLNANQSGNSTFVAAAQAQQSFSVASAQLDTPTAPTVTATANTLKSLDVSWAAVANAVSYQVKIYAAATGSESAQVVGITGTSTTIRASEFPTIADSTMYYVSVIAVASSSERNSAESLKGTGTTNSPAATPTITFQPTGLNTTVGQSATFTVGATPNDNGVLSYQWQKDGTNISGATSSSLTRNPVATGDSGSYSVVVTNSLNGTTASITSNAVSLTVSPTLTITTPTTGLSATVNSAYSLSVTATGGRASLSFSTSSTLPTGITLSSAGVLSGTPTQSGTFPLTVTVTDLNSATATTSSFNLVVAAAPGLVPTFATPVSAISGSTDRLSVQITNYNASYTWSGTASIGTVSISNTGLITFSGVSSGQTTTATITTERSHYLTTSATVSATLTPIPVISYNSSDLNSYATDGVVRDLSGRGNNGTAVNGVDIVGSRGSWNFTGGTNSGGDYIDLPDLSTSTFSSGITIDFEADFASGTAWERILDFSTTSLYVHGVVVYRVGITDSFDIVVYRNSGVSQCTVPDGTITSGLNRYTIMLNSSSCLAYKNGSLVLSESKNMSFVASQTLTNNYLGRSNRTNEIQFEGEIRSLRLYAGTPTFNQIGAISYKTLSYNSDGGSAVAATTRTTTSGETLLASAVSRTGYSFLGWYDSTNTLTRSKIGDAGVRYTPSSNTSLFAGWDANTLNVTFNSNSGTLVTSTTTRTGEQLAAPADPTRLGYTFAGWFPDNSLSGTAISFPYAHVETTNFTLWAKWTPNPFTVTFVTGGGSAVTDFTTRTAEALPNSFTTTRAGYNFDGWFTDSGFSQSAISFPYTHGQTANFTLYAKWTAKNLTVSFNANGGSAVTSATTRTDQAFSTTATSARDGYTFEGWFADAGLSGSKITFPYTHNQTANFTLYAKWEAIELTVSFESNGGSAVTSTTVRTNQQITSAPVDPTRTGYTFAGWHDTFGMTNPALSFPHTHGRTSNIILYAKWTPNVNTVTFDANFVGGSTRTQSITSGVSTALTANVFTRTGYTFDGWSRNNDGTGTNYTNLEVVGVTSSFTLYAKWSANTLNVTFNTNSGSAITATTTRTGQVFNSTATTSRAGYTFAGWFDNPGFTGTEVTFPYSHVKTDHFTLYAKWNANDLTVTFNTNSGTAVTAVTTRTAEVMPTTLTTTRAGYTFLGWFVNSDLTGNAISFPYTHGRTENFTLHAKWDANTLNVNFATNAGSAVTATTTRTGESLPTSFTTTRAGYNFLGWFDNAEFSGSAISFPYTHGKTGDFTLFAKWDASTLTVSYNTNGGSSVTATTTRTAESIASAPTAPTRAGYTFIDWFATSDLSGTAVSFPYAHGRTTNFTLYAKWDANTLNVTFDSNSGSAVTGTTTRTAESIASAPTAPTRAGYTFDGWYDNPGFNNSQISFPYAHGKTENFTLYAKWDANTLTVSFVPNGGSAVTAVTTRTAEAISSAPVAPTRAGYDLVGWFDNAELTGSAITFPYTHGKTESFTLYAKWEAKTLTVSFNPSGGSAVSSMTTRTAESMASAPTPPTRAGYNFLGWVENGDLTGTVVSFPYAHGKTGDFTLYAKWDANTLNVTFNTNGGAAVTATTVRTDGQIAATVTTTRAGYTLVGWFDNEGLTGSAITFPYTHGKTDNFTLFAKWNANTLNVTFDTNSGTAVTATTTRTDIQLSATVTTTRAGYTFAGWFGNPELTGTQVSFPHTHGKTANFTLYAKWTPNTLNVRFEINDGTGDFVAATTTTGSEVAAPATNPSHPGFEFMGWSATEGGSALTFPYLHGRTTDFTLHAVWKAGNYTVVYQYNGATGGNSVTSQSYTTDIARTGIVLPVPTRTAYTFTGWRSDISLETPLTLKPNGRFVPVANQTVYAKWTPLDYTVTYNPGISANSGTVPVDTRLYNIGQTVSLLANSGLLGRTGYDFAGWLTSPSSSDAGLNSGQTVTVGSANINFYPKWTPKTYSISYNLNGGTGSLTGAPVSWTVGTSNVTLPSAGFTRTGYDFGGWARTAGGSAVNNSFSNNFVDESLTAIWTLKNISYTFAPGGVSSQGITRWPANASGNFGAEITLPDLDGEIVTISGNQYLFFGWGDGSATYRSGQKFVLTETPPQFTAQWVKLLDVKYSLAGGTKSVNDAETNDGDLECVNGGLCAPNQEITLRGAPTRVGYTFAGWKTQTTSETIIREAGTKTVIRDDNYLFFAEWTPIDYNFTFNSLGGSINNSNLTGNIGRVLTLPSAGTRTGYTFSGWSPDLGVTKFAAGPTYVIGSASAGFEATWIPDVYTIAFDWQGGIGSPQANSSFTVGRGPMTLPVQGDRVKDGFNFAGWSTTPGGEVVSNYEPTANGVLYAKWVDGNYTLDYNDQNGPTPVTQVPVQRTSSTILRTPTRANFRFLGWFDALTGGNFIGDAGDVYVPTASKTLYARWVQSSFYGVDEAALETATTYTASSGSGIDTTITHNPSGSQARIQIPAGTLPNGTVVSVRYFKDVTRQRSVIGETNNYFFSVIVSWLLGTGPTATVPDTLFDGNNIQKPITVTLSNSQIKAGAMVYQIIDGIVTPMQRATVDGSITVRIYSDPELVVAATPPTAPRNVLVVGPGRGSSTVSWIAPQSNGGSPLTNYNVYLDGVLACSAITVLSCELTNLSDSNTYNVRVIANNAVGGGEAATTSFTTQAPPSSSSGGGSAPGPVPPVAPPVAPPAPVKPPVAPPAPVAPAAPPAPPAPVAPSDPGAAPAEPGPTEVPGAPVSDDAPPVPFDPLSSPEGVKALTDSLGNAAAAVGAIAAAAAAAAAAAGAAGGGSGGSGGSGSGGQGNQGGSIATIDAAHERFTNRRRGRGDKWKIWKKKWLSFSDKFSIATVVKSAKFSPLFSKIAVDGAYLRAAFGSLGLLPTVSAAAISVMTVSMNEGAVLTPQWQWFIVLAVIGIFDAFAGLVGTLIFVAGTVVMHGGVSSMDDVRLLLGVIIVGYGPALLANAFRAFRKEPEEGEEYWYERLVDLVVLPFIGGWVTATMISILPALAGTTMAVANHVNEFAIAIAIAITIRVIFEEFVGRWFPARLDTLHPTDVDDPKPYQKWISVSFRLGVFVFVTAALMGNVWQVWVGSALFILPTIIGFYAHRFRNFPWIWRIMPTGIPGLAFALIVASVTTSIVNSWFGSTPDLALWSFALLPIPMLGIAILAMIGREGNEGEIRWIRRPGFKWVYRIGGVFMLLATMELAGVLDIFPF